MINDIVARLRRQAVEEGFSATDWTELSFDVQNACDEIELLQEWKELAYQMRNKYWWAMRSKTLEKFDAMHKADWARHDD